MKAVPIMTRVLIAGLICITLSASGPSTNGPTPTSQQLTDQQLDMINGSGCTWEDWIWVIVDMVECVDGDVVSCLMALGHSFECANAAVDKTTSPTIPSSTQVPWPDPCPDGYQRVGGQSDGNGGWTGYKCGAI